MKKTYNESPDVASVKGKWDRSDTAKRVSEFESRKQFISQRDFAKKTGVPRSTLRDWIDRKDSIDADPVLIEFFESPVGIAFLHRLVRHPPTFRLLKLERPASTMSAIF